MKRAQSLVLVGAALLVVAAGCKKEEPPVVPTAAPPPTYTAPPVTTPAPAPVPTPDPNAAGGMATPVPATGATMAQPLLDALVAKEVAGMTPDGSAFAGNFQQGQILEQPFQIQPGKCYTVVGVGVGITQLDVQIVLQQPPLPAVTAAQSSTSGPQAVLGGKGQCFKNPFPIGAPGKVVMKATSGAGLALARIYIK
ncbi:MAG: hypothetical protein HY908_19410 [Myxococcales bacterium]|nr:hypothetical protein [Myxococcales bacterium]